MRHPRDLPDQLRAHRTGEVLPRLGGDDEGAGAADHLPLVTQAQRFAEARDGRYLDGERVHSDALRHRRVARVRGAQVGAHVRPVARHVDDAVLGPEGSGGDQRGGMGDGVADRVVGLAGPRRGADGFGQRRGGRRISHRHPVDHRRGTAGAAPFHHGDGDRSVRLRGDGGEHRRMRHALGEPFPLQAELVRIDGSRGIHREHQQQVHGRRRLRGGEAGREQSGQSDHGAAAQAGPLHGRRDGARRAAGKAHPWRAHQSRHMARRAASRPRA